MRTEAFPYAESESRKGAEHQPRPLVVRLWPHRRILIGGSVVVTALLILLALASVPVLWLGLIAIAAIPVLVGVLLIADYMGL